MKFKPLLVMAILLFMLGIGMTTVFALQPIGEAGQVNISDSLDWTWIEFDGGYSSTPVILATPVTNTNCGGSCSGNSAGQGGMYPIPVVKDITTTGFNFSMCIDGGSTTCTTGASQETFHYFVFDIDIAAQVDWIEVNTTSSVATDGSNSPITYLSSFNNTPHVWTQAQTYSQSSEIGAVAWVTSKSTSGSTLIGCVHTGTGDNCDNNNPDETFGWVAIDTTDEEFDAAYGFQSGSASISNSDWTAATFSPAMTQPLAMVTQNSDNGNQDPQYAWAQSVTTTGMNYRYCEQDAATVCNGHTGEDTFWFAVEQAVYNPALTINWNQTFLQMGGGIQSNGNLTGFVNVTASENQTDVNVSCISGNCSTITNDWVNLTDMVANEQIQTTFTCDNETTGIFSAQFNLTSANSTRTSQLTVQCSMFANPTVVWNVSTLAIGSVFDGLAINTSAQTIFAGSHTSINITKTSGNGTGFMSANPTTIANAAGGSFTDILVTCNPANGQAPGTYLTTFRVNSTQDPTGDHLNATCEVLESTVNWNVSSINLGSTYAGTQIQGPALVTATGSNLNVAVTEISGTGSSFTSPDITSIGNLNNTESQEITFTCAPQDLQSSGGYSTLYNTNATYTAGDNITVSCTVLAPFITLNNTEQNLTSSLNSGTPTFSVVASANGSNNATTVTCTAGDCATITDNFVDNTDLLDSQTNTFSFTCDDSAVGSYSATFIINSTQDPSGETISVGCEILQTYGTLSTDIQYPLIANETLVLENETFYVNASVECIGGSGAICGNVSARTRDNSSLTFGDSSDGSLVVSSTNTVVNQYTFLDASVQTSTRTISVNDTTGFGVGDQIMVIQMQNGTGQCLAGAFEFRRIVAVGASSFTLDDALENNYCYNTPNQVSLTCDDTAGFSASVAQVVRIPEYTTVTVQSNANLTATPWDGYQGGIVAFRANNSVTIDGNISVTGTGFRGGQDGYGDDSEGGTGEGLSGLGYNPAQSDWDIATDWEVANTCMQNNNGIGGAGSWCSNDNGGDPGAGGGHATAGQTVTQGQGQSDSDGGSTIGDAQLTRLFFGGGGGAGSDNDNADPEGDGGAGGGIVFIASQNISGAVMANGQQGLGDSGSASSATGGGGAGGTIWLRAINLDTVSAMAFGGIGGNDGSEPGGLGGDGRIRLDFVSNTSSSSTPASGFSGEIDTMRLLNASGTPFFTPIAEQPCSIMNPGDTCNVSWQVNASGLGNASYSIDALFYSNESGVSTQHTPNVNVTIVAIEPFIPILGFTVTLPGGAPVNASNSSNTTQDMSFNIATTTAYNVNPCVGATSNCQNGSTPFYVYQNVGNINISIYSYLNQSLGSKFRLNASTTNDSTSSFEINTTPQILVANLTPTNTQDAWFWGSFISALATDSTSRELISNGTG